MLPYFQAGIPTCIIPCDQQFVSETALFLEHLSHASPISLVCEWQQTFVYLTAILAHCVFPLTTECEWQYFLLLQIYHGNREWVALYFATEYIILIQIKRKWVKMPFLLCLFSIILTFADCKIYNTFIFHFFSLTVLFCLLQVRNNHS